jgi:hypothetical protein
MEMGLRGPEADSVVSATDSTEVVDVPTPSISLGPLLYAGLRQGPTARVFPVAEITESGLRPLPHGSQGEALANQLIDSRLRPGAGLILFHQGARIGVMHVDETLQGGEPFCGAPVQARGVLQLTEEGWDAQQFLALEENRGRVFPFVDFLQLSSVYDQRVASLNLGSQAIPRVGARWPTSLLDIRQDIQVFQLPGGEAPAVMATFLFRDQLVVGPAPDEAYSLLVLGEPRGSDFELTYSWYRPVSSAGKGAPRFFSRLDWDGDGDEEILLEVLGPEDRWFAALNRGADGWTLTYEDPCGSPGE